MCRVVPETVTQLVSAENALVETHATLDQLVPIAAYLVRELSRLRQGARERRPVDAA